jgi:hypothetical protein
LGSWDSLLNSLLHNPFLGSGRLQPPRFHTEEAARSQSINDHIQLPPGIFPPSWVETVRPAVEYAIGLANLRELAKTLPSESQTTLSTFAEQAIADFADDLCPPYRYIFGWPPPPPPWWLLVSIELVAVANTAPAAGYREAVLQLAGQIAQRGLSRARNASPGIDAGQAPAFR